MSAIGSWWSMNLSDIATLNIDGTDYHCIINRISKSEAANLLEKTWFKRKMWNIIKDNVSLLCKKDR